MFLLEVRYADSGSNLYTKEGFARERKKNQVGELSRR